MIDTATKVSLRGTTHRETGPGRSATDDSRNVPPVSRSRAPSRSTSYDISLATLALMLMLLNACAKTTATLCPCSQPQESLPTAEPRATKGTFSGQIFTSSARASLSSGHQLQLIDSGPASIQSQDQLPAGLAHASSTQITVSGSQANSPANSSSNNLVALGQQNGQQATMPSPSAHADGLAQDDQMTAVTVSRPQHGVFTVARRDRKLDRKKLDELTPADDVSKYLFRNSVPRWMDVCNRRPDRNDTVVVLNVGNLSPRSADEIERDLAEKGTLIKSRLSKRELSRRRRSISYQVHERYLPLGSGQVYTVAGSEKSAISFKRGDVRASAKRTEWWPKTTSFRLSPLKSRQHLPPPSKNRYLVSQPGENLHQELRAPPTPITDSSGSSTTLASQVTTSGPASVAPTSERKRAYEQIKLAATALFHRDVQMSWQLIGSLNTIDVLRKHLDTLNATIQADLNSRAQSEPEVSNQRKAQIVQQRNWLPRLGDLVLSDDVPSSLNNITGGLYDLRVRQLLVNMTEYIQFFNVALEQMKFDQQYLNERDWNHAERYRNVDKSLQTLLCEIEYYFQLERDYLARRDQFHRLTKATYLPDTVEGVEVFYDKLINNRLPRDRPNNSSLVIESPVARAFRGLSDEAQAKVLDKMETFLPENRPKPREVYRWQSEEVSSPVVIVKHLKMPTHIWREVMPLAQRQLYTAKERAVRDSSVLQELPALLRSLESLLINNFM